MGTTEQILVTSASEGIIKVFIKNLEMFYVRRTFISPWYYLRWTLHVTNVCFEREEKAVESGMYISHIDKKHIATLPLLI